MHSSRMRTVHCSNHLLGGGGICPGVGGGLSGELCVCPGEGCLPRGGVCPEGVSVVQRGCLPRGGVCLGRGVSAWGVSPQRVSAWGCLTRRVCPGWCLPGDVRPGGRVSAWGCLPGEGGCLSQCMLGYTPPVDRILDTCL